MTNNSYEIEVWNSGDDALRQINEDTFNVASLSYAKQKALREIKGDYPQLFWQGWTKIAHPKTEEPCWANKGVDYVVLAASDIYILVIP